MRIIKILLFIILMTGCASIEEQKMAYEAQAKVVQAQTLKDLAKHAEIDCSEGCGKAKIIVYREPDAIQVPRVRGTNDVIVETMPSVARTITWLGGAFAATRIVDDIMANSGGGNTTTHTTNVVNGDDNETSATSTLNKTDANTTMRDTFDSNDTVNSYNDNSDNSITDRHDAVSQPTVVPAQVVNPVVVDPVIVSP